MQNEVTELDDSMVKPGFDARLGYYRQLENLIQALNQSLINNDVNIWLRCLWGMFFMVNPYIKPSEAQSIKSDLKKVGIKILQKRSAKDSSYFDNQINSLMIDLSERLFVSSKYMMLPIGTVDDTEFDIDKFWEDANQ